MDTNNYNILLTKRPHLPDLPTDIALQTFTDISLRSSIDTGAERSDHEALSVLGRSACETAFTAILYTRRPNLGGEGIVVAREEWMSDQNTTHFVKLYEDRMKRVRCSPGTPHVPELFIRTWFAYMGGLYLCQGERFLERFLHQLVEPDATVKAPPSPPLSHPHHSFPHAGGPQSTARSWISVLNEAAVKRGAKVDYEPESGGPQHSLQWKVTALVDGQWKGHGTGSSKQQAKEEAAKEAMAALKW